VEGHRGPPGPGGCGLPGPGHRREPVRGRHVL